jgi:hypothetical protein
MSKRRNWLTPVTALGVALTSALLSLPHALAGGFLSPDSVEHLAIANAWIHGAGFVCPVQWHYYLAETVPLPAFAIRPPVVPLLAAIVFAFGATVRGVIVLHAVWASLITAAMFLVASRFMRRPAAAAAALMLSQSKAWVLLSATPLTEATAVGSYLLVLATARAVTRSVPAALVCAVATLLAWLTRPNLGALVLAVAAAALWELGPKRGIRNASTWVYVLGFSGLCALIYLTVTAATGHAPYAGYGIVGETFRVEERWQYQREWIGTWAFIQSHADEIFQQMGARVAQLYHAICLRPLFLYVGWLIPPAVFYALWRPRDGMLEHRINALSVLGFSLIIIMNYAAFDSVRYPLMVAVPTWLCALAMLDDAAQSLERRLRRRWNGWFVSLPGALPLAAAVLLLISGLPPKTLTFTAISWQRYQEHDIEAILAAKVGADWRELCPYTHKDAIIATYFPGACVMWCGNAAVRLPLDLSSRELQDRFIAEKHPRYFITPREHAFRWLRDATRFREITSSGPLTLFEVRNPTPKSQPWRAPPPLICAGMGPDCARRLRR